MGGAKNKSLGLKKSWWVRGYCDTHPALSSCHYVLCNIVLHIVVSDSVLLAAVQMCTTATHYDGLYFPTPGVWLMAKIRIQNCLFDTFTLANHNLFQIAVRHILYVRRNTFFPFFFPF